MQLLLKVIKPPKQTFSSYFSVLLGVSSWFRIPNLQTAHLSHEMNLRYVRFKFFQKNSFTYLI